MIHGEPSVIERRAGPGRRGVARGTIRWRKCGSGCGVVRIRCAIVIYSVATVAIGRQRRKVVVHVAARTRNRCSVKTSQWERRCVVIKRRRLPHRGRVAQSAVCWEPDLRVVRTRRALVVSQVARDTGSDGQAVVVVDVAACASDRRMKTSQREARCRVIEYRSRPGCGRVAERAVGRERCRNMIRHRASKRRSALPGSYVATVAGRGTERVVVAHVAGNAGRRRRGNVHPRQGKPRCAVVERCGGPTHRRVAGGAVRCRKCCAGCGMRRGVGLLPGCQMAA